MKTKLTLVLISILGLIYSCKKKDDVKIDLNKNLVAYYPFSGNANDESGNSNNGTVYDATLSMDRFGNNNSAYYFNGSSSYIDCGNNPLLKRSLTDFSICFWINPSSYSEGTTFAILSNRCNQADGSISGSMVDMPGPNYQGFDSASVVEKRIRLTLRGGIYATFIYSDSKVELDKWTFVTVCYQYNGSNQNVGTIYLNGVKQVEKTMNDIPDAGSTPTYIGFEPYGVSPLYHFHGFIDDVRIYNKVISNEEINALFKLQ